MRHLRDVMQAGVYTRQLHNASHAEVVQRLKQAVQAQGFGVVSEIDIAKTLREKIGEERPAYTLLGICQPRVASAVLRERAEAGLGLPCTVAIYQEGTAIVLAMGEPNELISRYQLEALRPMFTETAEKLRSILATV